jgi:hypothetical protein
MAELDGYARSYDLCEKVDQAAMRFVRTMMALLIALSVAMLPAAGAVAAAITTAPHAASEAVAKNIAKDMTMASGMSDAMDDCCPDCAKANPCKAPNCRCPMAVCAVQLVNLAATDPFRLDFPITAGTLLPLAADQVAACYAGSPPFRPPQV